VGLQRGEEDLYRRARERGIPCPGAQCIQSYEFPVVQPGNGITTTLPVNTSFGQTTGAYRDLANTNDTGGRIIEFVLKFNF